MRKTHFIVAEPAAYRGEKFACGRVQQIFDLEGTYDAVQVTCRACLNAMERTPHATCYLAPAS